MVKVDWELYWSKADDGLHVGATAAACARLAITGGHVNGLEALLRQVQRIARVRGMFLSNFKARGAMERVEVGEVQAMAESKNQKSTCTPTPRTPTRQGLH